MTRRKGPNLILLILGLICNTYGLYILVMIGVGHWFNFAFIIIGLFLISLSFLWNRIKKASRGLKTVLLVLVCIGMIVFCFAEFKVISFAVSSPKSDADYVIILGAKVHGTNPSREFYERIYGAYEYLLENPKSFVICTGGKGSDEGIEEAIAAKNMLLSLGIQKDRIITEEKSTTTEENLKFSKDILKDIGVDISKESFVIVSSSFHLYRASLHAKDIGYMKVTYLGTNGLKSLLPHYFLREFAALTQEYVLR